MGSVGGTEDAPFSDGWSSVTVDADEGEGREWRKRDRERREREGGRGWGGERGYCHIMRSIQFITIIQWRVSLQISIINTHQSAYGTN